MEISNIPPVGRDVFLRKLAVDKKSPWQNNLFRWFINIQDICELTYAINSPESLYNHLASMVSAYMDIL